MVFVARGVVSDKMFSFGLESSPDPSIFLANFCGAIILKEIKLACM
jgi:hypothetical protein